MGKMRREEKSGVPALDLSVSSYGDLPSWPCFSQSVPFPALLLKNKAPYEAR